MTGPGGWTAEVARYYDDVYLQPPEEVDEDEEVYEPDPDEEYDRMKEDGLL